MRIPQEVREVLRPENNAMNRLGREVDVLGSPLRTENPGPLLAEGPGEPPRKPGDEVGAP